MALNAKKVGGNGGSNKNAQAPIDAGTYPCRVVQVIDLGLQPQRPFKGEAKPPAHTIMLTYEFLDEFCLDEEGNEMSDKPRWLSETIPLRNLKSELATSTKRYKALDPEDDLDGDFLQLVGIPCMTTVSAREGSGQHAGKVFNNIASVSTMRPKEAEKAPDLVNAGKCFQLDEPDLEVLGSLPEWLQDKIKENLEFSGSNLEKALAGGSPKKEEPKSEKAETVTDTEEDDGGEW